MRKIYLMCSEGMSTSILVKRMQATAQEIGYDCSIDACPIAAAAKNGRDADIILLGPQVRFFQGQIEQKCPGVKVLPLDMKLYGRMDAGAILTLVKTELGDR